MNRTPRIALVGTPNSGKTTLFNGLTGLAARVGNYPGITVECREGAVTLPNGQRATAIDLPGTYSLAPRADDEAVAVRGLLGTLPEAAAPDLVIAVVDATALERNLYTVVQLRELGLPLAVALTMMDVVAADGIALDIPRLEQRLGVPVLQASGHAGDAARLREALPALLERPPPTAWPSAALDRLGSPTKDAMQQAGQGLAERLGIPVAGPALGALILAARAYETADRLGLPAEVLAPLAPLELPPAWLRAVIARRYEHIAALCEGVRRKAGDADGERTRSQRFTDATDRIALHPLFGPLALLLVMGTLFQTLFAGSAPLMDAIEDTIAALADAIGPRMPDQLPLLRSLITDGVIAGVGNVVIFVPQIAVLFLFLGLLEDSGYLARAAFLLDRLMAKVGLHGRAFVPLLSGFACAVPAILATRTIENTKDRFVTILVTPLVSCSARLPVYALMISTVFATQPPIGGWLHPGVLVLVAMYLLGLGAAVAMAALFKRTLLRSPRPALVLELPPYRIPRLRDVLRHTLSRVRIFLTEAGTVILALTVVLWGLFTFPRAPESGAARDAAIAQVEADRSLDDEARAARVAALQAQHQQRAVEQSIAGQLGKALEPVIEPLGFDWKIGVGLIASFAAREVLVSTLGLVYGLGEGSDEASVPLREAMRADVHPQTGEPVYTPLTALSLMVFFVLAMQCMSTVAVVRREMGSWKWAAFLVTYMTALAYAGALLTYQGGRWLGLG